MRSIYLSLMDLVDNDLYYLSGVCLLSTWAFSIGMIIGLIYSLL